MQTTHPLAADRAAELLDRLSRIVREMQFAEGLNPAQWEALRYIARANRPSRTPGALAAYLGATKGTVSQTLIALEGKGLVRRVPDRSDRRRVAIATTPAGEALLDRDPMLRLAAATGSLSHDSVGDLTRCLDGLLGHLRESEGLRTFGICHTCGLFVSGSDGGDSRCGLSAGIVPAAEADKLCIDYRA